MEQIAIYPGSFDPVTNGHLDVIERASRLFDRLIVAIAHNDQKQATFSPEERLELIRPAVKNLANVEVTSFDGLLVDFVKKRGGTVVIRGLRAVSDFEFEFQMALINRKLYADLETLFLTPKEEFTYLSSRLVKEVARLGGDTQYFVPHHVSQALKHRFTP
jgi:pantetheine-phosphate adenylyltransferase